MNYLYKYLAVGCVLALASFTRVAMAAPSPDGTEETNAAASTQNLGTSLADIDVASYLIRNLYREPDKDASDLDKWTRGWLLSVYWNPNYAGRGVEPHKEDLSLSGVGMAISKDVSPASTFRLDGSYRFSQGYKANLKRWRVSADYLFNISNFYYGYDLSRKYEWLLSMGIQGGASNIFEQRLEGEVDFMTVKAKNQNHYWGGVHMGLQYRKNIDNNTAFFIENQFELNSDNWDGINNQYDIDPSINLMVGLIMRLGEPKRNIVPDDEDHHYRWFDNTFMQVYGGVSKFSPSSSIAFETVRQYGGKSYKTNIGEYTGEMPGINFGLNIGKWLNPSFGVRVGYFEQVMGYATMPHDPAFINPSKGNIDENALGYNLFMTLRGGRAELLFNPLSIFADRVSFARFGWEIFAGLEVGQMHLHRYGYNNYLDGYHANDPAVTFNHLNFGATFGTQLKYFVNNHIALFAEGRISSLSYNGDTEAGFNTNDQLGGSVYSASLGIEYYLSKWNRYDRFPRWDKYETKPIERLKMDKRFYLEAAGGLGHEIHWGEHFPNMFDIEATVGLGMHYNDYLGFRSRFSYGYRSKDINITSVHGAVPMLGRMASVYRLSNDVTFNLTNLWMGVDHDGNRMGDVYLFAGPVIAGYNDDVEHFRFNKLTYGGNVGIQLTRRLSPEWELFLEPRYEFFANQLTNRWDLLAGVIYHYNAEKNAEYKDELSKHANLWFMELGAGAGLAFNNTSAIGTDARLAVGRRFSPYSSVRLNGMLTLVDPMDKGNYRNHERHDYKMEVGVDYMYNLTNLWYGVVPFRKTNLRAFIGPNFQLINLTQPDKNTRFKIGAELGVQWSYNLTENFNIFVEPRLQYYEFDKSNLYGNRFDLLAGVIWYNDYHTWRANRLFFNDDEHYPLARVEAGYVRPEQKSVDAEKRNRNWYWDFALGMSHPMGTWNESLSKLQAYSPTVSLGVGYNFDNYSAVVLNGTVGLQNEKLYLDDPNTFSMFLGLDYRFNLTNMVMGINQYRPMDAYLFAGPSLRLYDWGRADTKNEFALGLNFGGRLAYHMNNHLDLFGELRYNNYWWVNNWGVEMASNPYRLHSDYSALAGITWYNTQFDRDKLNPWNEQSHQSNWFFQFGGGLSHSLLMRNKEAEFNQTNSYSGFASMGYAFTPLHSVRLDGTLHVKPETTFDQDGKKAVAQVGMDYMFNASRFILGENPYRRFDLQLLAGPQARLVNINSSELKTKVIFGATAGMQLDYHLNRNFDLFTEARYDFWEGKWQERADIYAGLAYYMKSADQREKASIDDFDQRDKNWFWTFLAGVNHPFGDWKSDFNGPDLFSPAVSMGLGYQFDKFSSLRMDLNYARLQHNYFSDSHMRNLMYGGVDYMFNLTNLMMGRDGYRPLDAYLLGGPMLRLENYFRTDKKNTFALGWMAGAQFAYHLNDHLDLIAEGRYENWKGGKLDELNERWGSDDLHNAFDLFMGLTWYNKEFNHDSYKPWDSQSHQSNWFYQYAGGLSHALLMDSRNAAFQERNSISGFIGMGYVFNPLHRVRVDGTLHVKPEPTHDMDGKKSVASVGLDYMFNVSQFLLGENPYRRFDLQLLAGPQARIVNLNNANLDTGVRFGATAGMQFDYHLNRNFDLFTEARYDFWQGKWQERADIYAGLAYYTKSAEQRSRQFITDYTEREKNWFWNLMGGVTHPMGAWKEEFSGLDLFSPAVSLGLGYNFGKYSSLRLDANYAKLRDNYFKDSRMKNLTYGGLDYMFNVTNLLMGRDNYRPIDGYILGGQMLRLENFLEPTRRNTFALGWMAGAQLAYHVTDHLDVIGEARYENWESLNTLNTRWGSDDLHNAFDLFMGVTWYNKDRNHQNMTPYDNVYRNGNWFYQAGAGLSHPTWAKKSGNNESAAAFGALGYQFGKYSSVRGTATGSGHLSSDSGTDREGRKMLFSVGLDYMFNVSNLLYGVNPYRRIDMQLFAGPTVRIIDFNNNEVPTILRAGVDAGAQLQYHINRSFDLFGELRYDFWQSHWQERLSAFGGLTYYTKPYDKRTSDWRTDAKTHEKNWFVEAALGGTLGLMATNVPGASNKIGLGYVFGPYSTVRGNLINHWNLNRSDKTFDKNPFIAALDLEYMLNVTNLVYGDARRRVELLPFVGGAARLDNLSKTGKNLEVNYGAIFGAQANYHLTQYVDLFAEGQFEKWLSESNDDRLSAYVGTRFYNDVAKHTTPSGKPTSQPQPKIRKDRNGNTVSVPARPMDVENKMTSFLEVGIGLGGSVAYPLNGKETSKFKYVDATLHAGAGMHFNPYLSARARANVTLVGKKHVRETSEGHSFIFETAIDGMWNMTNTLLGINPYRKMDAYAFVGPTLRLENLTDKDRTSDSEEERKGIEARLGINGGGRLAYHLNNNIDLIGEGRLDWLDKTRGYHNRYEAMAGMSFRLDNRVRKSSREFVNDHLFLQLLAGYQVASVEGTHGFGYSQNNFGKMPNLDYRIGYRFNEVWGIQGGLFSQQVNFQDWKKGEGSHMAHYGARAELTANVLNLFNTTYDMYATSFNWSVSGGMQLSRMKNDYGKLSDVGFTVATQAQYLMTSNTWAVLELRAQQVNLDGVHIPVSVMAGLQHDLHGSASTRKVGEPINDNRNHWQISAGAGAYNGKRGGFEGALYYRVGKHSAFRLKGEAFNNGYPQANGEGKLGGYLAAGADYMLNASDLIFGIDDYRRTNMHLFAGGAIVTRGLFKAMSEKRFSDIGGCFNNGMALNYGAHIDVKLSKKFSLYTEARCVNLFSGTDLRDTYKDSFNLFTTFGVKYNFKK